MASNKTTSSIIYSFFKKVPLDEKYLNKENSKKYSSWQCVKSTCLKIITIEGATNSNLRTHLLNQTHSKENEEYSSSQCLKSNCLIN